MGVPNETRKRLGYFDSYVLAIEGYPILLTEEDRVTYAGAAQTLPTGYTRSVPALRFKEGDTIGIRMDRESGFASATAVEFTLGWDDLGAQKSDFKYPGVIAELTADLAFDATTVTVDDTTGFGASGTFYLGREAITYTGKTGTSFTGCTRGVVGFPYAYSYNSPTFRQCCDVPKVWRGRFVTLYASECAPDGRLLNTTMLDATYSRAIWRGYIDDAPKATKDGIVLRVMPLCRLPSQPIGHDQTAELKNYGESINMFSTLPILDLPSAQATFYIPGMSPDAPIVLTAASAAEITTIGGFVQSAAGKIGTATMGVVAGVIQSVGSVVLRDGKGHARFELQLLNGTYVEGDEYSVTVPPGGPYWLETGKFDGILVGKSRLVFLVPFRYKFPIGAYIAVRQTTGEAWNDLTVPSSGIGIFEAPGSDVSPQGREIIRWDAKVSASDAICSMSSLQDMVLLRISARAVNDTPRLQTLNGGELQVLSGTVGTFSEAFFTICESSGTGNRGDYDTLGISQGYGVPRDYFNGSSFTGAGINQQDLAAVVEGRSSLEDILGGFLALNRKCFLQSSRPSTSTGEVLLSLSDTSIVTTSNPDVTITASDVLTSGIESPSALSGPNEVQVDLSGIDEGDSVTVQDLPRIQAEGLKSASMSAPSVDVVWASYKAASLIAYSDGQQALRLPIAPWVYVQPGDTAKIDLSHPAIYDWQSGTLGPSTIYGRVAGWKLDLWTGHQEITVLLSGNVVPSRQLCPTAKITATPAADQITIDNNDEPFFKAGQKVKVYNRGEEDTRIDDAEISSVSGSTLTMTASLPAWIGTSNSYLAFPDTDDADSEQDDFAFFNATTKWT